MCIVTGGWHAMTAVVTRPEPVARPTYRRPFSSGVFSIAAANGLIAFWAVLTLVRTSVLLGVAGLLFAGAVAYWDARYDTPTRLEVSADAIELGYWRRTSRIEGPALVLTHDVPRDRFTLARRGRRRSLVRFRAVDDSPRVVAAFMAAGVEILSR